VKSKFRRGGVTCQVAPAQISANLITAYLPGVICPRLCRLHRGKALEGVEESAYPISSNGWYSAALPPAPREGSRLLGPASQNPSSGYAALRWRNLSGCAGANPDQARHGLAARAHPPAALPSAPREGSQPSRGPTYYKTSGGYAATRAPTAYASNHPNIFTQIVGQDVSAFTESHRLTYSISRSKISASSL